MTDVTPKAVVVANTHGVRTVFDAFVEPRCELVTVDESGRADHPYGVARAM
ncbi:MAG TPA: hypothetical protein VEX15_16110 [Nocardioidaceae bacterium]|nr:hypothetical protein [Nocardioidaceae bacterium]